MQGYTDLNQLVRHDSFISSSLKNVRQLPKPTSLVSLGAVNEKVNLISHFLHIFGRIFRTPLDVNCFHATVCIQTCHWML